MQKYDVVLKKEICKACCEASAEDSQTETGWDETDQKGWDQGFVLCPTRHCWPEDGKHYSQDQSIEQIPEFCPHRAKHEEEEAQGTECPFCGSTRTDIVGNVGMQPRWHCKNCEHKWVCGG